MLELHHLIEHLLIDKSPVDVTHDQFGVHLTAESKLPYNP